MYILRALGSTTNTTQAPATNTTAASQYEALEAATSSVERQPQFVVIQFAVLLTLFALLFMFSRQHRRAALKGNGTASRKIVLPALEPILSTLCLVSLLITGGFTVVLMEQTDSANVSALVNEIAYSGKQFVLVLVLAHVVQRQFTTHALWSSILLALVLSCYTIPVAWCLNSVSEPFPSSQAYLWALSAARAFLLLFYTKMAIRPPSSRASPGSTREYCAFAVTSHVLSFAVDAISHSGKDVSADALAYANLILTSLCPLFIWRVLRGDTEHWRRTASHTCELHSKLLLELNGHAIRISRVQFLQERVSSQGLHLHIEMQPKLVLDFGALEIKQRLVSYKRKSTCAQVFSGVLHLRTAVAVKVYTPANFADETLARFAHEAALCGALHHPNIVRFYGMCVSPPSVSFATELCTATLRDVLRGMADDLASYTHPTKYHFLVQLGYILDATRAVAYLHSFSPAFLHRDLRSTSFVVDQDGNVKLTGLGEAKNLPRTQYRDSSDLSQLEGDFSLLKSPRSTVAVVPPPTAFDPSESSNVEYMPPEVLSNLVGSGSDSQYEEAIDVFALAMIMWDVLHPDCERFPGLHSGDTQSVAQAVAGGYRPKIALHVHSYVRQLIESSWEQDARLRPSTQYIVSVLETIQEEVMNDLAGELYSDLGGQFYGEEAVMHLIRSRRVTSKPQAIRLGNALMDAGVLHHVNHSKGFEVCKYGVYYVDESCLTQQIPHRDTQARIVAAAELGLTDQDRSSGEPSVSTMPANHHPKRPRQLTTDSNDSFASTSPHVTRRAHRVESFEPDQLRLIDSTLCACRRLGQRMEEPAKLVRRTRRPTPRLLEEENSLTADLLTDAHTSTEKAQNSNRPHFQFDEAASMAAKNPRIIALFDVDGTLTPARKDVSPEMTARLQKLRQQITIGVVGGSDLVKQKEQLGENVVNEFDYSFSENGLVAFHKGVKVGETSLKKQFTNEQLNRFVNFVLRYIADLDIPIKRGTFLEFRMGMINVSPIGRNCSQEERDDFEKYDHVHNVRKTFVEALKKEFVDYNLTFSIGGQISFDVFPSGWDKTFALRFLDPKDYDEIHFFGDKTYEGGNDFEIYTHERTIGHSVTCPEDTIRILDELFPVTN